MTAPAAPRTSIMTRMFTDAEGELRSRLIIGLIAGALVLLAIMSMLGLLFGGPSGGNALGAWVVGAFLFVKLPLLVLIWWVLGRRRERGQVGGWTRRECGEILDYLEREARAGISRADAPERLAYYSREAWFVAMNADDADTARAVETAHRIDAMAQEVGVDTARTRDEARMAGSRS